MYMPPAGPDRWRAYCLAAFWTHRSVWRRDIGCSWPLWLPHRNNIQERLNASQRRSPQRVLPQNLRRIFRHRDALSSEHCGQKLRNRFQMHVRSVDGTNSAATSTSMSNMRLSRPATVLPSKRPGISTGTRPSIEIFSNIIDTTRSDRPCASRRSAKHTFRRGHRSSWTKSHCLRLTWCRSHRRTAAPASLPHLPGSERLG
jgi:hypothetical protein